MRARLRRRLEKQLRRASRTNRPLVQLVQSRTGPVERRLTSIALDTAEQPYQRAEAARLLQTAGEPAIARRLVEEALSDPASFGDGFKPWLSSVVTPRHIGRLHRLLRSSTHDAQIIDAAHTLESIGSYRAQKVLVKVLLDRDLRVLPRTEAAEQLGMFQWRWPAVRACISCLSDPDAGVRFWCAYALGHMMQFSDVVASVARPALESRLSDHAQVEGWWSVAQEAKAWLVEWDSAEFQEQLRTILDNPNASPSDRRWAKCYAHEEAS